MRIAIPGQRIPKSSVRFHASIPGCACAVSLEEIRRLVTPAMAALDEKLAALQGHVDRIASDVHRISHDLHPSTVAHLGLVPALRRLCREFSDRMQISVDFVDDGSSRCLPEEVAVALYRVSQECLANVAKHSHSPAACITLQEAADELRLTIADQGVGFDVSRIATSAGLGLVSIQERARNDRRRHRHQIRFLARHEYRAASATLTPESIGGVVERADVFQPTDQRRRAAERPCR